MLDKEIAQSFLFKVDMDGLDYAVVNYAPKDTGDKEFDDLVEKLSEARFEMKEYISKIRKEYDIDCC